MKHEVMRRAWTLAVLLSLSACTKRVPMVVVTPPPLEPRQPQRVLLVIDEKLRASTFKSSQLATSWVYPLGEILPAVIERTFTESFQHVTTARNGAAVSEFDLVVHPELTSFDVDVPSTVFSQTRTAIGITYRILDVRSGREHTISAEKTHEVLTDRDKELYRRLTNSAWSGVPSPFIVGNAVGFIPKPKYEELAARDATLAVINCVDELNYKIRAVIDGHQRMLED